MEYILGCFLIALGSYSKFCVSVSQKKTTAEMEKIIKSTYFPPVTLFKYCTEILAMLLFSQKA